MTTYMKKEKGRKGQGGFTLIELMIVIAIIAILAAVAIPNFMRARYKANFQACKQQLVNIRTGMELAMEEEDNLALITDENSICHHVLPGYEKGECDGQVLARVNEVCKDGTLAVAPIDDFRYNIKANAKDRSNTLICVTEAKVGPAIPGPDALCFHP